MLRRPVSYAITFRFLNSRDILHRTVVYECDQKACGDKCTYPTCHYTFDISHAVNFEPSGVKDDFIEKGWIPIEQGCKMPEEGEEVLITLWMDESYGADRRSSMLLMSVSIAREAISIFRMLLASTGSIRKPIGLRVIRLLS